MKVQNSSLFFNYSLSGEKLENISKVGKAAAFIFAVLAVVALGSAFTAAALGEAILALTFTGVCFVIAFDSYIVSSNAKKANFDRINRFGHIGASIVNGLLQNTNPENAEFKLLTKNAFFLNKLV